MQNLGGQTECIMGNSKIENSAIRNLRNEKGTGAEVRPAIVSGILLGDTWLSLCFKTRVQSYWYENNFL